MIYELGGSYFICDFMNHRNTHRTHEMCSFLFPEGRKSYSRYVDEDCVIFAIHPLSPDVKDVFFIRKRKNYDGPLKGQIEVCLNSVLIKLGIKTIITLDDDFIIKYLCGDENELPVNAQFYQAKLGNLEDLHFDHDRPMAFFNNGNTKSALLLYEMLKTTGTYINPEDPETTPICDDKDKPFCDNALDKTMQILNDQKIGICSEEFNIYVQDSIHEIKPLVKRQEQ